MAVDGSQIPAQVLISLLQNSDPALAAQLQAQLTAPATKRSTDPAAVLTAISTAFQTVSTNKAQGFTAYDVTTEARATNPQVDIPHEMVRDIVFALVGRSDKYATTEVRVQGNTVRMIQRLA